MENEIEYIEEEEYLIRNFHGTFHVDEIIKSWEYLIKTKLQEKKYLGIINDFSNAQLKMKLDDLEQLLALFKKNMHLFKDLKLAVIMTTPDNVIFPIFAKDTSPFNIAAFTTLKAAQNWVLDK